MPFHFYIKRYDNIYQKQPSEKDERRLVPGKFLLNRIRFPYRLYPVTKERVRPITIQIQVFVPVDVDGVTRAVYVDAVPPVDTVT